MQSKYRLPLVLGALVALSFSRVWAQPDEEDEDDFGTFGFLENSPKNISVSMNIKQGAQVQFGNLGIVPANNTGAPNALGVRTYNDGVVRKDAPRPYFLDANGKPSRLAEMDPSNRNVRTTPGVRYTYTGAVPADNASFISYAEGKTRDWSYNNAAQATQRSDYIGFNLYSTKSNGASQLGNRSLAAGVELAISHHFTDPSKRVSFSLTATVALAGIYSDKAGTVDADLYVETDYYSLNGQPVPVTPIPTGGSALAYRYSGPSFTTDTSDGTLLENTTVIADRPDIDGGEGDSGLDAEVTGDWKIKGAYFTLKVGPEMKAMLTRSIGLSASVGVAGSYVGSTYTATESFKVDGVAAPIVAPTQFSNKTELLSGYYANIDAVWALNERSGIFAGVSYEKLGDYTQSVGGRTAKIDLGSTAGIRGGLNIKF